MLNRKLLASFAKRQLLNGALSATAGIINGLTSGCAVRWRKPDVTQTEIDISSLRPNWDGAKIAIITDLHIGRRVPVEHLQRIAEITNDASPDIVALTGDYISDIRSADQRFINALAAMNAPEGKFAVLGNHDYYLHKTSRLTDALEAAGVIVLSNAGQMLLRDGQGLYIAGVDDPWGSGPDLSAAVAGAPTHIPRILLCHNPDFAEKMPTSTWVDLILAGHTHGGQINLPILTRLALPTRYKRYVAGLVAGPNCPVYVSRGLGVVGMPIRYNCPPEIAIITLRSR